MELGKEKTSVLRIHIPLTLGKNNFPLNSENYWLLQCTNQDETLMPVHLT